MVYDFLRALPGVHDLLVTVARKSSPRALSTSPGVPGPHAFAVRRLHHSSVDAARVHRIPPRVRDDAHAPLIEAGRRQYAHIMIFVNGIFDANCRIAAIVLNYLINFDFQNRGFCGF